MLRASLQCQVPSDPSRGASASARALAPSSPIMFSAVPGATSSGAPPSGHSSHRSSLLKQRKGWQGGGEGFGEHVAAPSRSRVLRALLQCQLPSDPNRGASAFARAFAPSGPILFPAAPAATSSPGCLPQATHHTDHPSSNKGRVWQARCRTSQVQGVEGLVAVPGAVRPLPRGQRIRQSLRPLGSNLVPCSNRSSINRAPPSGHSPDTPPLFKREQGRQQQGGGKGFGKHVAAPSSSRVLRALLQCQVPSDPSRGASASARAFAPSSPISFPAATGATSSGRLSQASHPTPLQRGAGPAAARGRERFQRACSRTLQVQGVEGLVAVPGAVRPLPWGQRIRQSLGPLSSDAVGCSTSSNIIRAPPSGQSPHPSSKGSRAGSSKGEGRASASMLPYISGSGC